MLNSSSIFPSPGLSLRILLACACYGVIDVAQGQIFVSTTGSNGSPGTLQQPVATIAQGIVKALTYGQSVVRVHAATYVTGALAVPAGMTIEPGFDDATGGSSAEMLGISASSNDVRFQTGSTLRLDLGTTSDTLAFSFTSGRLVFENAEIAVIPGVGFGAGVYTIATGVANVQGLANVSVTGVNSSMFNTTLDLNGSALQLTIAAVLPDITVEQPADTGLIFGSASIAFGVMPVGAISAAKTFIVKNTGLGTLALTTPVAVGGNAVDFTLNTTDMLLSIPTGQQASFSVAFAPALAGSRSTTLHIASNDPDENPFDITLTGTGLSFANDGDGDGLSDASEFNMSALGFDWQVAQTALVNTLTSNLNSAGYYSASQVQALNTPTPLIHRNPDTGVFTLTLGVEKSTTLAPNSFSAFPMNGPGTSTSINGQGKLEFHFTVPDNAAFFQLRAE